MEKHKNADGAGMLTQLQLGESFILHRMAEDALEDLDLLFESQPSADHGWSGLFTGPTGSGKSAVLRAFCSKHKPSNDGPLVQPVISVKLPNKCNTRTLSQVLLIAQRDPAATKRLSIPEMQQAAVEHLKRQKTRMVIFDEAQHATRGDAYEAANFFKHITNESKAHVLLTGLPSAADLLDNDQLEGRTMIETELRAFDWWDPDDKRAFLGVLKQLQAMIRLPVLGFNFTDSDWNWRFAYGSRGLMRPIVRFLVLLESYAARKKLSSIDEAAMKRVWDKLPKKDRLSRENPFKLKDMPKPWKPAGARTGERD